MHLRRPQADAGEQRRHAPADLRVRCGFEILDRLATIAPARRRGLSDA
jgi:hypothetical protein